MRNVQSKGRSSNRPVQETWSEELVKLHGGPRPGPSGYPAVSGSDVGAQKQAKAYANRLLVNKRVIDTRARERPVAAGNRGSQVRGAKRRAGL